MGLYPEEWDHNYSKISAKLPKRGERLAVKEPLGQFRVETSSQNISSNLPNKMDSRIDLFTSRLSNQLSKYFAWRPNPRSQGTDAMQHPWGANTLCIPTFLNDQKSFKQIKTGKGRQNTTCGANLAISNLVSDSAKYVNRETNIFTTIPASTHESTKTVTPTSDKQNLKIRGVDSLRENLFTGGFSETASQIISSMQ